MMNGKVIALAGATVGASVSENVVRRIPSLGPLQPNMVTLAGAAGYLIWDGGPDGDIGAFVDGLMIGIAANSARTLIPAI